jgi:hypothetical protein
MTVIWQRKKKLLCAFLIGIIITAIPMGGLVAVETVKLGKCRDRLVNAINEQNNKNCILAYRLKENKNKGDMLLESDLIQCELYCEDNLNGFSSKSELIGKSLKFNVEKGVILNSNMVYEKDKVADDVRLQKFSDIELHDDILEGSVIDIRIVFPNGEDYIVAEHKQVVRRIDNSILIYVSEEEILKMASANVDRNTFDNTKIYAVLYAEDYQEAAKSDYPVNTNIIELGSWNPNLVEIVFDEETANKRNVLENNMAEFMP